uniref:Putative conserved secreted protein n=1 Tax=Ixodes ricinus TaxID=34613 RepID=A0A6B0V758_IXORI
MGAARFAFAALFFYYICCIWPATFSKEITEPVDPNAKRVAYRPMDENGRPMMGYINPDCDDGKKRLNVDHDERKQDLSCGYHDALKFSFVTGLAPPRLTCDIIPPHYHPPHYCMDTRIKYPSRIPTFEGHRPLWPRYGEYNYVPPQRWLHSIEHGAVVMLYHPCARWGHVQKLRTLLKNCIRKHIITPYLGLTPKRPLALVSWGCRLEMSFVKTADVVAFIRYFALNGPEGHLATDGQYSWGLVEGASVVKGSDFQDSNLCPFYKQRVTKPRAE